MKNEHIELLKSKCPKLVEQVEDPTIDTVIFHQDAFAADYQEEEYFLLGIAVKYIGRFGKEIRIIGKNEETINEN
jgi:pyruvate formate-lyase activating enzyme-like uncharacterized protein